MSTDEVVEQWETEMADLDNCTVTVEASSSMSFMSRKDVYKRQGEAGANHGAEHGQQGNGAPELGDGNISLVENPPVQVHQKSLQGHDREHD